MQCPKCNREEMPADARYCPFCGVSLTAKERRARKRANCKIIPLSILSNVHKGNSGQNSGREKLREVP